MELLAGEVCTESVSNMLSGSSLPTSSLDSSTSLDTSTKSHKNNKDIEHIAKKPRLSFSDDFELPIPSPLGTPSRDRTPSDDVDDEIADTRDDSNNEVDTTTGDRSSVQEQIPNSSTSDDGIFPHELHHITAGSPSQQKSLKKRKLDDLDASESISDHDAHRNEPDQDSVDPENSDDDESSEDDHDGSGGNESAKAAADGQSSDSVRTARKESFRKQRFDTLASQLRIIHSRLPDSSRDMAKDILEVMQEKVKQERRKSEDNNVPHPRTAEEIMNRLKGDEENKHSWLPTPATTETLPKYAFRAFTEGSQSKINDDRVGFQSRKSYGFMNTPKQRALEMQRHLDWRNRHLTPFISTSCSWAYVFGTFIPTFKKRYAKKGNPDNTKVALINFSARQAAEKPVISVALEGNHYGVHLDSHLGFGDEFLCPYEIGPDEIVCTWRLDWIEAWQDAWIEANLGMSNKEPFFKKRGRRSYTVKAEEERKEQERKFNEKLAADAFQEEVAKPLYEKHEKERLEALISS